MNLVYTPIQHSKTSTLVPNVYLSNNLLIVKLFEKCVFVLKIELMVWEKSAK